jgi:transcriptional regulator with XRE-family HTH domain
MLKELRTSKGIPITFVANLLGISRDRVRNIEACKSELPCEFIPALSNLYGVSYQAIIDGRVKECKLKKSN